MTSVRVAIGLCSVLLCGCGEDEGCIPDCETRDSSRFQTGELYPQFSVYGLADGKTHVEARWAHNAFGSAHVRLAGGDRLMVNADAYSEPVQSCGNDTTYCAVIPTTQGNTEFVLKFERGGGRQNATSRGTLGKPFRITAPQNGARFTYNDTLTVTWTDFGSLEEDVGVELRATCTSGASRTHGYYVVTGDDDGVETISLRDYADTSLDGACARYDVELSVARVRAGTNDPAYAPSDACETGCFRPDNFVIGQLRTLGFVLTSN